MRKIIRLTETDLANIVKRVIREQSEPTYDYVFSRGDNYSENTMANKLYFVSNGDSFDVWVEQKKDTNPIRKSVKTNMKLPKESELGLVYNESSKKWESNNSSKLGNRIAKLITPTMDNGNWVFFVSNKGIPTIGNLVLSTMPVKGILDRKGIEVKLKDQSVLTYPNYVVTTKPSRQDEYGKGLTVSLKDSKQADKKV
jgi:hypothetical protein